MLPVFNNKCENCRNNFKIVFRCSRLLCRFLFGSLVCLHINSANKFCDTSNQLLKWPGRCLYWWISEYIGTYLYGKDQILGSKLWILGISKSYFCYLAEIGQTKIWRWGSLVKYKFKVLFENCSDYFLLQKIGIHQLPNVEENCFFSWMVTSERSFLYSIK